MHEMRWCFIENNCGPTVNHVSGGGDGEGRGGAEPGFEVANGLFGSGFGPPRLEVGPSEGVERPILGLKSREWSDWTGKWVSWSEVWFS